MTVLAQIFGLSGLELALIALIIIVFFGAAKIPQLARSFGKARGEFEKGTREGREEALRATGRSEDDERVIRAARELGIPTEGRAVDDIRRDLKTRV
jgi:sec-independent protein translocase protein TatA